MEELSETNEQQVLWERFVWAVIDKRKVPPEKIVEWLNNLRALFLQDEHKVTQALMLIARYREDEENYILSEIIIAS